MSLLPPEKVDGRQRNTTHKEVNMLYGLGGLIVLVVVIWLVLHFI
jgi:hypothetical protein